MNKLQKINWWVWVLISLVIVITIITILLLLTMYIEKNITVLVKVSNKHNVLELNTSKAYIININDPLTLNINNHYYCTKITHINIDKVKGMMKLTIKGDVPLIPGSLYNGKIIINYSTIFSVFMSV